MELDETKASVASTQVSFRSSPCKMQFYLIHSTVNINTHNLHGYLDGKENKNVRTFSFVLFTSASSSEIRPWESRAFKGGIDFQSKSRHKSEFRRRSYLRQRIN